MSLTEKDLQAIEQIVDKRVGKSETYLKDYVGFAVEKSEVKMVERFDKVDERFDKIEGDIKDMKRSIDGLIETDQEFLGILGKHDQRITRLEVKTKLKIA